MLLKGKFKSLIIDASSQKAEYELLFSFHPGKMKEISLESCKITLSDEAKNKIIEILDVECRLFMKNYLIKSDLGISENDLKEV